jgi:hypothetical protein
MLLILLTINVLLNVLLAHFFKKTKLILSNVLKYVVKIQIQVKHMLKIILANVFMFVQIHNSDILILLITIIQVYVRANVQQVQQLIHKLNYVSQLVRYLTSLTKFLIYVH